MNVAHRKYLLQNRIVGIVRHHWKCIEYVLYFVFFSNYYYYYYYLHYILYYNISIRYINLLDSYYSISIVLQYLIITIIFTLKLYKVNIDIRKSLKLKFLRSTYWCIISLKIYECVKINHFRKIIIILIDIIQNYVFMFLYFCPATKLTKHSEILLNSA